MAEHGPHCETCTCGCTCGFGGQHEPGNLLCELNPDPAVQNPLPKPPKVFVDFGEPLLRWEDLHLGARVSWWSLQSQVSNAPKPPFQCPKCGRFSHNHHDVEERYCGACHEFF